MKGSTMRTFLVLLLTAAPAMAFVSSPAAGGFCTTAFTMALSANRQVKDHIASRRTVLSTSLAPLVTLSTTPQVSAIETYLTEPTEEFKESERQRMEFRKKQLVLKGEFVRVLAHLTGDSLTEEELIRDLMELRGLVIQTGGLPLGIKKEDMYKVIRSKKTKGFWPTNVEIAYQKLKSEVAYQQSPNTEKDLDNPL